MILAILVFSIKTLKTHFCHKAKNKDSWVFKIYMGIHTPSKDSHTNIYVNQPKTKRVMAKKLDFLLLFLHRTTCNKMQIRQFSQLYILLHFGYVVQENFNRLLQKKSFILLICLGYPNIFRRLTGLKGYHTIPYKLDRNQLQHDIF